MSVGQTKISCTAFIILLSIFISSSMEAKEKIIQQEKISFEKCLKVIISSENKLSIAPKITDISDKKRIALFTLVDGTLTIACNKKEGTVTVSTNKD